MPAHCIRLIGPRYALLRPEFAQLRDESLARRKEMRLGHILISMGGVDKDDATSQVLDALADCPLPEGCRMTVVMGRNAPWLDHVRAIAKTLRHPTQVMVDVTDMAALMVQADLAIGAAGGTSWERCALGLPTLIAVLADNQQAAAAALSCAGAAIDIGRPQSSAFPARLIEALRQSQTPTLLRALSRSAAAIATGEGSLVWLPTLNSLWCCAAPRWRMPTPSGSGAMRCLPRTFAQAQSRRLPTIWCGFHGRSRIRTAACMLRGRRLWHISDSIWNRVMARGSNAPPSRLFSRLRPAGLALGGVCCHVLPMSVAPGG